MRHLVTSSVFVAVLSVCLVGACSSPRGEEVTPPDANGSAGSGVDADVSGADAADATLPGVSLTYNFHIEYDADLRPLVYGLDNAKMNGYLLYEVFNPVARKIEMAIFPSPTAGDEITGSLTIALDDISLTIATPTITPAALASLQADVYAHLNTQGLRVFVRKVAPLTLTEADLDELRALGCNPSPYSVGHTSGTMGATWGGYSLPTTLPWVESIGP